MRAEFQLKQVSEPQSLLTFLPCAAAVLRLRLMLSVTTVLALLFAVAVFLPAAAYGVSAHVLEVTTTSSYLQDGDASSAAQSSPFDDRLVIRFNRSMDSSAPLNYTNIAVTGGSEVTLFLPMARWNADATQLSIPINGLDFDTSYRVSINNIVSAIGVPTFPATYFFQTASVVAVNQGDSLTLSGATLSLAEGMAFIGSMGAQVAEVSAGSGHTLAIDDKGHLWAWGFNAQGQLGLGDLANRNIPHRVPDPVDGILWQTVAAGSNHSLAIDTAGNLWAWGNSSNGQLGTGSTAASNNTPQRTSTVLGGPALNVPVLWESVSAGIDYTLAIDVHGSMWAWGNSQHGKLGLGNTGQQNTPLRVPDVMGGPSLTGAISWRSASAGVDHSLAVDTNGVLWAWGDSSMGQLGLGNNSANNHTPRQVRDVVGGPTAGGPISWYVASTGSAHSLAIDTQGNIWTWGSNTRGQLGLGNNTNFNSPQRITGGASQWQSVSTGETHSLAVGTDGSLWAWGSNENGQLGIGASFVNFNAPQRITNSTTSWQSVSTGTLHSLAIDADGALWTWGTNDRGQLGKGVASAGAGQGTYNWLPWRVAASLMSTSSTDWTIPANATMPSNGAVGLGIGFSPVTIYFDRPMRTDVVGTIVIDNGGSVNVAGGVWSDSERGENTVFSASLRLFEFDTLHTATVSGFIDAAFGQIAANEMYPYTWTFTTEEDMSGQVGGGLPEGQIFFTENSCSTCHFTEDIVQEHALRANGCQTCHRYSITQKPKTNWSRVSSDLDLECKSEIAETGCMTCHGGTNNEIHSEQNKTVAHSLSFGTDTEDQRALRGCSGSGCHSATLDGMAGGFGFGDLDLASAHNDFWQAARDGRVSHACNIVPSMLGDANPYGCGLCHERTSNEKSRLRAPIASRLAQADVASNGLNCLTCHADSMNSSGSYSLKAFAQHNDLRVPVTMTQGLRVGGIPAPSAFSAIDLLAGLSPEMRVEFAGDLTHADDRLQPGVLQPAADELRLAQQQAAQHWLEHRRGSMGDFLSR